MQILRLRRGFQADHSSSSYLFYAEDHPVSAKGQQIAHRYSSRAEVDERTARYQKWGESSLSFDAYKTLLGEHYDVMASESYDWWTMMIAIPKTADTNALLSPFREARGYEDLGIDVDDYGRHLVVNVYCMFDYDGSVFSSRKDCFDTLVELLSTIRGEILRGNISFLRAVASFYDAEGSEDDRESLGDRAIGAASADAPGENLSKAELQQECTARGIVFRKSWTKGQLRTALATVKEGSASAPSRTPTVSKAQPPRLSPSARRIINSLSRP